jgi:hypothetical protein
LHCDRPVSRLFALELVQTQARRVHIFHSTRLIKHRQHKAQPGGVHGLNASLAATGEKQL